MWFQLLLFFLFQGLVDRVPRKVFECLIDEKGYETVGILVLYSSLTGIKIVSEGD